MGELIRLYGRQPHKFQRESVMKIAGGWDSTHRILNVGCKEDPAGIGDWQKSVNIDVMDHDPAMNLQLADHVKNFIRTDFFDYNPDLHFDIIVLGEVLEHCTIEKAHQFLVHCHELTVKDGWLVLTTPHDPRKKEEQYGRKDEYIEYAPGVTSWHQTIIMQDTLLKWLEETGFEVKSYEREWWIENQNVYWHMVTARKK